MNAVPGRDGWLSPALSAVATFLFWAALYLYVPVLPVYAQSLGAGLSMVGVVIASYAIAQLLLRIPIGFLADATGRPKLLAMGGLLAVTVGALGLALASNPLHLVMARTVTGGGAATWAVFAVLFVSYYPREQTGRAMGLINFINGIALVAATASGGLIAQQWGHQATFQGAVVLGILALAVALTVKQPAALHPSSVSLADLVGVATNPLLLTVSFMGALVHFAVFASVFGFVPLYATEIGASSAELGLITMLALGSAAVASLGASYAADRWGFAPVIRAGMVLAGLALFAIPAVRSVVVLGATQVVGGVGRGLITTSLMTLSVWTVPYEQRASALSVYQALYSIGMLLGPLVSGFVANAFGLSAVFYISGLLCLVAIATTYARALPGQSRTR